MKIRLMAGLVALVAATVLAVLAVPAFAGPATGQVNVTFTNSSCKLAFPKFGTERLILFHLINNGTAPHGIIVWGVKSKMALPSGQANLYVKFRNAGAYRYSCTTGSYLHPTILHRGLFKLGV